MVYRDYSRLERQFENLLTVELINGCEWRY